MASLKINANPGTYAISITYNGSANYSSAKSSYNVVVKSNTTSTKLTVKSSTVVKGNYLNITLTDSKDNVLSGEKIIFTIFGKNYTKTTNSSGIASLKINANAGSYTVNVTYPGGGIYDSSKKSVTITVKAASTNKNGVWVRASDKNNIDYTALANNGIKNIFISYVAVSSSDFTTWLNKVNNLGFNVHIWMQVFYDSGWINPILSDGSINSTLFSKLVKQAKSYASIDGIAGIHLDYIRFPGTAYKYTNGQKAVTQIVQKLSTAIKSVNSDLIVSCTMMGESVYSNAYYYGQNITQLSSYVDVIIPMVYKGNYNKNSAWIKTQTAIYVNAVNGKCEIWSGLQSYNSDSDTTKLSTSALTTDVKNALNGGASGVVFFRAGLLNLVNMTKLSS